LSKLKLTENTKKSELMLNGDHIAFTTVKLW